VLLSVAAMTATDAGLSVVDGLAARLADVTGMCFGRPEG